MLRDEKIAKILTTTKVYCKCGDGHGVSFGLSHKDRLLCDNCGRWVYKDEKTRLKYELMKKGIYKEK